MFTAIQFERFRCFEGFELKNLTSVNLLTGKNGAGKTSTLEGIFLLCGANNAGLVIALSNFRNEMTFNAEVDRPFRTLFYGLDGTKPARVSGDGDFKKKIARRNLEISPILRTEVSGIKSAAKRVISGVNFRFRGPSGPALGRIQWSDSTRNASTTMSDRGSTGSIPFSIEAPPSKDLIDARFVTPYFRELIGQINTQLSGALKEKNLQTILDACHKIEPRLQNLVPLTEQNVQTVYADLGLDSLVPISVIGAGFFNLLNLVVTMNDITDGVVLIDEIEDGLHYSIRPYVVDLVLKFAQERNIQFFITTHSDEMIRAFGKAAVEKDLNSIALYRLGQTDRNVDVSRYPPDEFKAGIELDAELR